MDDSTEATLRRALCGALDAFASARIDGLVVGGIALGHRIDGEARVDHDVDLFIRESDVERAMEVLFAAGYEVVLTHPSWLFKARLEGATVDVLHRLGRALSLDEEMLARATKVDIGDCLVPVISREDMAIGQAGVSGSAVPAYWFQAVDLLRAEDVDWSYLARRGSTMPDRFKALLHFARSEGIDVPDEIIHAHGHPGG